MFFKSVQSYFFLKRKTVKGRPVDKRIASLFTNLMNGQQVDQFDEKLNFIEREFLHVLKDKLKSKKPRSKKSSHIFLILSSAFREDLRFLSTKPKYLLSEFKHFLSFYGFTYTAQMSLAIADWKSLEAPKPKPLFFIMDHERASNERTHIKRNGYKWFNESCYKLFSNANHVGKPAKR